MNDPMVNPNGLSDAQLIAPIYIEFASKYNLADDEIHESFRQLDTDNSKTLDISEVSAFLHGRYGLDAQNISYIFNRYDDNKNGVLEEQEFVAICKGANQAIQIFVSEEAKKDEHFIFWVRVCGTFAGACCVITVCTSLCCAYCYMQPLVQDMADRQSTRVPRMNVRIKEDLLKGMKMDRNQM